MKARKILVSVAALALVAALSIAGTLAYLTDKANVTNTFTVGNIQMTLTETDIKNTNTRTDKGNEYRLYPGQTYTKDPVVTIVKNSEDCYVRMLVEVKNIDQLKAAFPQKDEAGNVIANNAQYYAADGTFLIEKLCGNWDSVNWPCVKVTTKDVEGVKYATYEFRYTKVVTNSADDTELPALFQTITVPENVDNTALAALGQVEINIIGNAMQYVGFENNVNGAWTAFEGQN